MLYDVSTLYFETDAGDGFPGPGFSKERRLDPQITIGLLANTARFPLMVNAPTAEFVIDAYHQLVHQALARTARCYRTVQIRAGSHVLNAEDPLPDDYAPRLTASTDHVRTNLSQLGSVPPTPRRQPDCRETQCWSRCHHSSRQAPTSRWLRSWAPRRQKCRERRRR